LEKKFIICEEDEEEANMLKNPVAIKTIR